MANGQSGTTGPGNQSFVGLVAALISKVAAPFSVIAGQLGITLRLPLRVAGGALEIFNSSTTTGRSNSPILIYSAPLAAANTATWAPGLYKQLKFYVSYQDATLISAPLTFTGLTGTYKRQVFFNSGATVMTANAGDWDLGLNGGPSTFIGDFWIKAGSPRYGACNSFIAATQYVAAVFNNSDTTHDVTGFSVPVTPAPSNGYIEVWGVPS